MASDTDICNAQSTILCTQTSCCLDDKDRHILECAECKRMVHYRCTELPLYQLQLFLTKGYRKFVCINCVSVQDYLTKIIPIVPTPRVDLDSQILVETSNTDKEEVTKLRNEVDEHANSLKSYEVVVADLKNKIAEQQLEMKEQEEKFAEVGNPDYDALMKVEEVMKNKLERAEKADRNKSNEIQAVINERFDKIEVTIDQLITKKLKENSRGVEQIEANICDVLHKNKTYADSLKNDLTITNLATVMKTTKNDDLIQERERECRSANLIIYGISEETENVIDSDTRLYPLSSKLSA